MWLFPYFLCLCHQPTGWLMQILVIGVLFKQQAWPIIEQKLTVPEHLQLVRGAVSAGVSVRCWWRKSRFIIRCSVSPGLFLRLAGRRLPGSLSLKGTALYFSCGARSTGLKRGRDWEHTCSRGVSLLLCGDHRQPCGWGVPTLLGSPCPTQSALFSCSEAVPVPAHK